jgi:hypothetical protein
VAETTPFTHALSFEGTRVGSTIDAGQDGKMAILASNLMFYLEPALSVIDRLPDP